MPIPIVEHCLDGTIRYIIENGADTSCLCREIPVVAEAIQQLPTGGWDAAHVGCLACVAQWVAAAPTVTDPKTLECLRCGARRSAFPEPKWCGACGHDSLVIREPGCPAEGLECPLCHKMAAMVDTA